MESPDLEERTQSAGEVKGNFGNCGQESCANNAPAQETAGRTVRELRRPLPGACLSYPHDFLKRLSLLTPGGLMRIGQRTTCHLRRKNSRKT